MTSLSKRSFFTFLAGLPFMGAAVAKAFTFDEAMADIRRRMIDPPPWKSYWLSDARFAESIDDYADRRLKAIDGAVVERIARALARSHGYDPDLACGYGPDLLGKDRRPLWLFFEINAKFLAKELGLLSS